MKRSIEGPGLAKTRGAKLLTKRTVSLFATCDALWAELFEAADVVSEGASQEIAPGRVYFGSTNIVLRGEGEPFANPFVLASVAQRDPHVRLRALRLARREASQRAGGPLGRVHAELEIAACPGGVALHVEVEAQVFPDRRAVPRDGALRRGADEGAPRVNSF